MRLPLGRWLVTGIVSLCSTGALAADTKTPFPPCTTAPTEADRKAAQGAFAAGQGSLQRGRLRDCHHVLAGCLPPRLHGARAAFEPRPRLRAQDRSLRSGECARDVPPAQTGRARRRSDSSPHRQLEVPDGCSRASAGRPRSPHPPPSLRSPRRRSSPEGAEKGHGAGAAPFIIVGAGGVAAIVGAVVLAGGAKKVSDAEEACPNRKCPPGRRGRVRIQDGNDGRNQETIGGVVLGIGVAAIAGGLVWHFVSKPSGSAQATVAPSRGAGFTPVLAPIFAGLSLAGSF